MPLSVVFVSIITLAYTTGEITWRVYNDIATYEEAKESCEHSNSRLPTLEDMQDDLELENVGNSTQYWLDEHGPIMVNLETCIATMKNNTTWDTQITECNSKRHYFCIKKNVVTTEAVSTKVYTTDCCTGNYSDDETSNQPATAVSTSQYHLSTASVGETENTSSTTIAETADPNYAWYFVGFGVFSGALVGIIVGLFIFMHKRSRHTKSDRVELCPVSKSSSNSCNGSVKSSNKQIQRTGKENVIFPASSLNDSQQCVNESNYCTCGSSSCIVKVTLEKNNLHMVADIDDIQRPTATLTDSQGYSLVELHPLKNNNIINNYLEQGRTRTNNIAPYAVDKPPLLDDYDRTYAEIGNPTPENLKRNNTDSPVDSKAIYAKVHLTGKNCNENIMQGDNSLLSLNNANFDKDIHSFLNNLWTSDDDNPDFSNVVI